MKDVGEGTHAIHPEFQLLQTLNKRERVKVGSERFAVNPLRSSIDFVKNAGAHAHPHNVSQVILVGSPGKTDVHLYDV